MASTPTTKSQVQAYRFVLRRMESALVRKDAVMLHDPMGSHKRATVAGAVLAAIACIGFLVWGLFGGKGSVPQPGSIIIGKETGAVFVVTSDEQADKRLIPMLNVASAKLLVMAQGGAQGGGAVPTTVVKESALGDFPRGSLTGLVNAPTYLPDAKNIAEPSWAICDVGQVKDTINDARVEAETKVQTTVIGGDGNHGTELGLDQSLYVKDQTSQREYLIYRVQDLPGQPHTRVVKSLIDKTETTVLDMYGLRGATPRTISTNMLNAIFEVPPLHVPQIERDREQLQDYMTNRKVGDVVRRTVPGQPDDFYLLLPSGKQKISEGAAAVLHASKTSSREIPNATGAITDAAEADSSEQLNLSGFPVAVPTPVTFQQSDTSCLSWKNVNGTQNITATLNKGTPAAKAAVKLAQYDGAGPQVDYFYMPAGKAAVVRAAPNEAGADSGPIFLVADQGVQYGIKDVATAQGLGVIGGGGDIKAGPSWLTRVLPKGDFLDPANASMTYDAVPVGPGVNRPLQKPQQQQAGVAQAGS
ncbi:type VII secretion protein EccB [Saccharopolyspora antimicrobica]|uniref:Type VII secretion protein EccB n=1 Tax=Saccharopolyspora antimicrobica TaxID=455193 RepID=A0A1I5DIV5_9PSEU|nr:type VII secretion protein EccB [Saccharopolyspora antimicrobica]RKT85099.1 type VII secretion protein EccB [Saccharopolyspora antimicrobica]SFN99195.1 type VII secretion protein EccB [Saccharopolyspora antimicrobica]